MGWIVTKYLLKYLSRLLQQRLLLVVVVVVVAAAVGVQPESGFAHTVLLRTLMVDTIVKSVAFLCSRICLT